MSISNVSEYSACILNKIKEYNDHDYSHLKLKSFKVQEKNVDGKSFIKYADIICDDKKELIREIIKSEFAYLFFYIIFNIDRTQIMKLIDFSDAPCIGQNESSIFKSINILSLSEFRLISGFMNEKIVVKNCGETINAEDYSIFEKVDIETNGFKNEIVATLQFKSSIYENKQIIYGNSTYLQCDIYGIRRKSNIPLWMEYWLNSIELYKNGNKRMAYFSVFAGFDSFINQKCQSILQIYLDSWNDINNDNVRTYSLKKIKELADVRQNLLKGKFVTIMKEHNIDITSKDNSYNELYNELGNYVELRNKIVHGFDNQNVLAELDENDEFIKYFDMMYCMLRAICLMTYGEDCIEEFIRTENKN